MRSILPWKWVPSLYFSEGVPYAIIASVSVILLKDLQMSNRELAFLSSLLTLPWVLKPLWAPLIDLIWTKKIWFVAMNTKAHFGFPEACDISFLFVFVVSVRIGLFAFIIAAILYKFIFHSQK